jgi:hypothetical protein
LLEEVKKQGSEQCSWQENRWDVLNGQERHHWCKWEQQENRKVMPDSKVHVVNELVDEGESESDSDSK